MWGICLNTTFHWTLDLFLGLWEAAFTAPLEPHSAAGFLLPTSAMQKKTTWSSRALDLSLLACVLMRYEAHGWTSSFYSHFPSLSHGSDLECFPPSLLPAWGSALLRPWCRGAVWGLQINESSLLLPSPRTVGLIFGLSEISARLPDDVCRA